MDISFISPLSFSECVSRLEAARQKETGLLRWSVSGKGFTLRKNHADFMSAMRAELSESPQGTVIQCSMETDQGKEKVSSMWFAASLPFFACVALGLLLNGFLNGFSKELILLFLLVSAAPVFYFLRRYRGIRQVQLDRKEMSDFIQRTLDAKPAGRPATMDHR